MPLTFDPAVLESFFGTRGEIEDVGDWRILSLDYAGPALKYRVMLNLSHETVSISGDVSRPFGADSMYEIAVPCSEIIAVQDIYHHDQTCLLFFYGGTDINMHRRMSIMKAPNGELKVWPYYQWPDGHQFAAPSEITRCHREHAIERTKQSMPDLLPPDVS